MGGVEKEAIERAKMGTSMLRELQRAHEHGHDRTSIDPQSPSSSVSAARSTSAHARSLPPLDVNSVPADKAQVHVPVDDDGGTGAVEVFGRVASADAASFMSPRVGVRPSDESMMGVQAQVPSSPPSTSTPPASVQILASTLELPQWAKTEVGPESAPEEFESPSDLEEALRSEAYGWPRLVFPPLKKSGHIILDACTREGSYPVPVPTVLPIYQISSFLEMKAMC